MLHALREPANSLLHRLVAQTHPVSAFFQKSHVPGSGTECWSSLGAILRGFNRGRLPVNPPIKENRQSSCS